MSGYTPEVGEVRDSLVYLNKYHAKQYGDVDLLVVGSETAGQFDRMIAKVERAAAEKALTDAADELERVNASPNLIELEARHAGFYSGIRATTASNVEKLRARAVQIREGKA